MLGVGRVHSTLPLARVFLDWRAGRGIRDIGVLADLPATALLGTDLGRVHATYVTNHNIVPDVMFFAILVFLKLRVSIYRG